MKKRIKIFHIISSLKKGGRERQLLTIFKYTNKELYDLKIIYFYDEKYDFRSEYNLTGSIIKLEQKSKFQKSRELYRLFKIHKPDAIYCWGVTEIVLSLFPAKFSKTTLINGSIRHGITPFTLYHIYRLVINHFTKNIITNSKAGLKANLLKRGKVVYNGIDPEFSTNNQSIRELKIKYDIPLDQDYIFISVGNLVPFKDYYTIIKALQILENQNFLYLVIGKGPLTERIQDFVNTNGLSAKVRIINNAQKVNEYLALSDIFIHASKGEGCSNAILEAMIQKLIIIASKTGGTPEIIDESNGFLFNYGNEKKLSEILNNVMEKYGKLDSFKENAFLKAKNSFSIERMIEQHYKAIERTI